jgi:hypothetical protein
VSTGRDGGSAREPAWTTWRREKSRPYKDSNSDPWAVYPVANHYTDCENGIHILCYTYFFLENLGLKFYKTERTCQNYYNMRTSPNLFNLDKRVRVDLKLMPFRSAHTSLLFETEVHIRSKQSLLSTSRPDFAKQFKSAVTSTSFQLERNKPVHQFFRFHEIDPLVCSF